MQTCTFYFLFFFFNDTATTEIYTLSLHDALPILMKAFPAEPSKQIVSTPPLEAKSCACKEQVWASIVPLAVVMVQVRSEEHTSELQSRLHLVCRLLLEKKKNEVELGAYIGMVRVA